MRHAIVRLPDFDRHDGRIYQLNWLGKVRRNGQRFEIFSRFVPDATSGLDTNHYDCWVRLTDLPFLILGSRWYRGVMVGKPKDVRIIRLDDTRIVKVHPLSRYPKEGYLCLDPLYRLSFDRPASPVVELKGDDGLRVFVPTTEIFRSHYLGIPRAQASLLNGLHKEGLDNPSFEAWDPALTGWTNKTCGIARIAPARFLQPSHATYLARLLFSGRGRRTLDKLHTWVLEHFTQTEGAGQPLPAKLFPIPTLPYPIALWKASVVPLEPDENGRTRLLVTHIESFDAPEPFLGLECVDPYHSELKDEVPVNQEWKAQGKVLEPVPDDRIDNIDDGWDASLEPIAVANVAAIDEAACRRVPVRVHREALPSANSGSCVVQHDAPVQTVSTQIYGLRGSAVAPLFFTDEDPWPLRDQSLDLAYEAIRRATQRLANKFLDKGISIAVEFLPDEQHAFAFEIRRHVNSKRRSTMRQFVTAIVRVGNRHILVIDPEHRLESDSIPLGLVWRIGEQAYRPIDLDSIHDIVRHLEDAVSEGRAWTRLEKLKHQFKAVAVWHPAATLTMENAVATFSNRISARLFDAISDIFV